MRLRSQFRVALAASGAALLFASPSAHALDPEVTSDTAAQFYDVRSPTGETILTRRRLTTTLGVGAYDLLDHDKDTSNRAQAELLFRVRMRYDADYGSAAGEVDPANYNRFVPGFSRGPVDLMYGYVEGRRMLGGYVGFKLGRQYVTDALGWWSFDGGEVKLTTPFFVAVELYGGLEQRGGLPLSTPPFEPQGTWRGDRSGYDPSLYGAFQPNQVAPALGVALESAGFTWGHGRLTYRRVYNTGRSNTSEFASGLTTPTSYDGTRISSDRIGYSIDGSIAEYGGARAGIVYDFYNAKVGNAYASVDAYATKKLTLSLDYDYYAPTFDGDSIWNFFAGEGMNDVGARGVYDFSDHFSLSGSAHLRVFSVQTAPFTTGAGAASSPNIAAGIPSYFPSNGSPFDEGGSLQARYKKGPGVLGLRSNGNFGKEGDRVGADVFGDYLFEQHYIAQARASVWQWNDKLRPDRDATNLGLVLGAGYKFNQRSRAIVEVQQDMNRLVGLRYRAMLTLSFAVTK
jgi:hypothetical protein